jgi:hypothetical protein
MAILCRLAEDAALLWTEDERLSVGFEVGMALCRLGLPLSQAAVTRPVFALHLPH